MKIKNLFTFLLLFVSIAAVAQTEKQKAVERMTDSIKMAMLSQYAVSYPQLRQGFFATDIIGQGHVNAELNGKKLYEGNMNSTRIRSIFNVPVVTWGKNALIGTVSYQQQHFETDDITSYSPAFSDVNRSLTKTTVGFTATYTRTDSLFNHPVNFSGSIVGLTDEFSSVNRVNYLGSVTVPVYRNQYSALTIGLVAIIDPASIFPVVPIISYWHKYKGSDLELYVDLPQRIVLRKQLSKKSWVTAGSELGGSLFFFNVNQPTLPQNDIYSTVEIRTGATFEYLLTKKLVFGVNGGVLTTAQSRMYGEHNKSNNYFFKTTNGSVPYISFSVSFLPFLKSLK